MSKKVTIRDLAKTTNLSTTQVSKALNGYPDVSPVTKELVIKTAAELGYVPNKGARALASKKQTEVTVLNLNINNQVSENTFLILKGLYDEADKVNLKVSVDFISLATAQSIPLSTYLIQNGIERPVIIGLNNRHPYYPEVISDNFVHKCFILDNKIKRANIVNVNVDDDLGVEIVARHLKSINVNKALVIGAEFDSYVNTTRRNATKKHFADKGIEYDFLNGNYEYDKAQAEVVKMESSIRQYEAIFCFSDIMAVGANAALHELSVSIPIIGFDGMEITNYVYPKISTISQSFREKGVEIVKSLSKGDKEEDIVVKPYLIKR